MGNSEGGFLGLEVASLQVTCGTSLSGCVHFRLSRSLSVESLYVKLSGKEYYHYDESEPGDNSRVRSDPLDVRFYEERCSILRKHYLVHSFKEGLPPGDYSFPFSVPVPAALPGTFALLRGRTMAQVKYYLRAYVRNAPVRRAKLEVTVCSYVPECLDSIDRSENLRVFSCFCMRKGTVHLAVTLNKDTYAPGELADISVEVDNSQSSLPIRLISILLRRLVKIRFNNSKVHCVRDTVAAGYIPRAIDAGEVAIGLRACRTTFAIRAAKGTLANTYKGTHIDCRYFLVVRAETEGSCGRSAALEQEISVCHRGTLEGWRPPEPEAWNPAVLPRVKLEEEGEDLSTLDAFKP